MATDKQIEQPYPMPPGNEDDFFWNWARWLPEGVGVRSYTVVPDEGLAVAEDSIDGLVVRALISLDDAVQDGSITQAFCTILTDQTPPRKHSRAISFVARKNVGA